MLIPPASRQAAPPRDVESERQRERPGAESSDSEIRSAKGRRSQRSGDRMPPNRGLAEGLGVKMGQQAVAKPSRTSCRFLTRKTPARTSRGSC